MKNNFREKKNSSCQVCALSYGQQWPWIAYHLGGPSYSFVCLLWEFQVFFQVSNRSVYTWKAIISAHAKLGSGERALDFYYTMQEEGITLDKATFHGGWKSFHGFGSGLGKLWERWLLPNGREGHQQQSPWLEVFVLPSRLEVVIWTLICHSYFKLSRELAQKAAYSTMQKKTIHILYQEPRTWL